MIVKDWMQEASNEITAQAIEQGRFSRVNVSAIIAKHSPLKDGIAYMPVPRCETCKYWGRKENAGGRECERVYKLDAKGMWAEMYDGVFTSPDFGCVQWKAK